MIGLDLTGSLRDLNVLSVCVRLGLAMLFGGTIGLERGFRQRAAGLRTHMLLCIGAASTMLVSQYMYASYGVGDPARLSAQVISGIGFLGAGTIFTQRKKIAGLTTAASLWNTACLGIVTGYGYYWLSLCGCALVLVTLMLLQKVIRVNAIKRVEVRFSNRAETIPFINEFFEKAGIKVLDLDFHIEAPAEDSPKDGNQYTNTYTLHLPGKLSYTDVINQLAAYPHIYSVRTTNT